MTRAKTLEVPRRQLRHERRGIAMSRPADRPGRVFVAQSRRRPSRGVPSDRMLAPSLRQREREQRDRRDRTQVGGVTRTLVADASWCRSPVSHGRCRGITRQTTPDRGGTCRRAPSSIRDSQRCAAQRCVWTGRPGCGYTSAFRIAFSVTPWTRQVRAFCVHHSDPSAYGQPAPARTNTIPSTKDGWRAAYNPPTGVWSPWQPTLPLLSRFCVSAVRRLGAPSLFPLPACRPRVAGQLRPTPPQNCRRPAWWSARREASLA